MRRVVCSFLWVFLLLLPIEGCAELKIDGNLRVHMDDTVFYQEGWITFHVYVENNMGHTHDGTIENVQVHLPDGQTYYLGTMYGGGEPWSEDVTIWLSDDMLDEGEFTVQMTWGYDAHDEVTFELTRANGPLHEWWIELWSNVYEGLAGLVGGILGILVFVAFIAGMCGGGGDGILVIFSKKMMPFR